MKPPRPFIFTRWLATWQLCMGWFLHFRDHGVPCGIVRRPHFPNFAVWVHGVEQTGELHGNAHLDTITPDMTIHESCHGFQQEFQKIQEEVRCGRTRVYKVEGSSAGGARVAAGLEA